MGKDTKGKAKEPWMALFLSQLFSGLGQLYAGRKKRGIVLIVARIIISSLLFFAIDTIVDPTFVLSAEHLVFVPAIAIIHFLFVLFVLKDGWLCVRKHNKSFEVKPSSVLVRFLAIFGFIVVLVFNPITQIAMEGREFRNYKVAFNSMNPVLKPEDKLIAIKGPYDPARGDVIIFTPPHDRRKPFVFRVVGLPEENLEIRNGKVFINGEAIINLQIANNYYHNQGDYAKKGKEVKIPIDNYYVLGDNSIAANDSRFFGPVPKKDILGKAIKIYRPLERAQLVK